jgi:hypothetical protein
VPTLPDDKLISSDQFENYLRQFDPLPPQRLRLEAPGTSRFSKPSLFWAAVAALVIIAALMLYPRTRGTTRPRNLASVAAAPDRSTRPLTLQSANALLNHSPSFAEAVNALGSAEYKTTFTSQQSAFSVLGKDAKL